MVNICFGILYEHFGRSLGTYHQQNDSKAQWKNHLIVYWTIDQAWRISIEIILGIKQLKEMILMIE